MKQVLAAIKNLRGYERFQKFIEKGFVHEGMNEAAILIQTRYRIMESKNIVSKKRQLRYEELQLQIRTKALFKLARFTWIALAKIQVIKKRRHSESLMVVEIISASGVNVGDNSGKSDPFVYVQGFNMAPKPINPQEDVHFMPICLYKSASKDQTLDPIWNEVCHLPMIRQDDHIVLTIADQDLVTSNSILGQVRCYSFSVCSI